jgi:hypothetical protein
MCVLSIVKSTEASQGATASGFHRRDVVSLAGCAEMGSVHPALGLAHTSRVDSKDFLEEPVKVGEHVKLGATRVRVARLEFLEFGSQLTLDVVVGS